MNATALMIAASLLFATMGVCVKHAAVYYGTGELVMVRGLIGACLIGAFARFWGTSLRTSVPWMHVWRSVVGVSALAFWFYAIGGMPLATAITLNYMSSVWMAVFMIGGTMAMGSARVDNRLMVIILLGFVGVALVLKPTLAQDQIAAGTAGLVSGMLAALAYLQVTALGRCGEPELRIVFYFSIGSIVVGLVIAMVQGMHRHTWQGAGWLLAMGLLATTAQVLMTRAYAIGRPLVNASLQYLGIVFSAVYGVWLFDEPLTLMAMAGMVLIVGAGLAATRLRTQTPRSADVQAGIDT